MTGQTRGAVKHRTRSKRLRATTGGKCFYCGSPTYGVGYENARDWILDRRRLMVREHMVPVSRGGVHAAHNYVAACSGCNGEKGSFTLEEFRFVRGISLRNLNYRFAFEMPCSIERDWLACYSDGAKKVIIIHNLPSTERVYESRRQGSVVRRVSP